MHTGISYVLQEASNKSELMTKDKFRAGDSGSPMVDSQYVVYGVRTYGYNLRGSSNHPYANKKWQVQNHYMVIQEILFLSIISNTTQDNSTMHCRIVEIPY